MLGDTRLWQVAALFVLCYIVYKCIVHPLFVSPLSVVPQAHPSAALIPAWILWQRYHRQANKAVDVAHKKHGPIVRTAPNEVSVNCVERGMHTIYNGGFDKTDSYNFFDKFGKGNTFSAIDSSTHSARKRVVSHIYSKSYLQSSGAISRTINKIVKDGLLSSIEQFVQCQKAVDVYSFFSGVGMDIITAYVFGAKNGTNFIELEDERNAWRAKYSIKWKMAFWSQDFASGKEFLEMLGVQTVPPWMMMAKAEIEDWCMQMCLRAEADMRTQNVNEAEKVVYAHLLSAMNRPLNPMEPKAEMHESRAATEQEQRNSVASEIMDHITGHETVGIHLAYLTYHLAQHPSIQSRLRVELYGDTTNSLRSLDNLPLLEAFMMETHRLTPSISGPLPRVTPSQGCQLAGFFIPAGVRVSGQAYSLHKEERVFGGDAGEWQPDRWLTADEEKGKEMRRWMWQFGGGGRGCLGQHFATLQIKAVVAAIYRSFGTVMVDEDDAAIEQQDGFLTPPKSGKLLVKFVNLE